MCVSHHFNFDFGGEVDVIVIKHPIVPYGSPSELDIDTGDGETQELLDAKLQA